MHGYQADRLVPLKRQKIDEEPVLMLTTPAVTDRWLPDTDRKATSDFQSDYKLYHGVVDDTKGSSRRFPAF